MVRNYNEHRSKTIVSAYRVPQMLGVGRADDLSYFKCPTTKQMR